MITFELLINNTYIIPNFFNPRYFVIDRRRFLIYSHLFSFILAWTFTKVP